MLSQSVRAAAKTLRWVLAIAVSGAAVIALNQLVSSVAWAAIMRLGFDPSQLVGGVVIPFVAAFAATAIYLVACRFFVKATTGAALSTGIAMALLFLWQLGVEGEQGFELGYSLLPAYVGIGLAVASSLLLGRNMAIAVDDPVAPT